MREDETLRNREHPNIVPLLASFTLAFMESEVEMKSLNLLFPYADMDMERWMHLSRTPSWLNDLGSEQRRQYLYQSMYSLVSAISFLHRELDGMITSHHDLKPKNILVMGQTLKICDFGRSHMTPLDLGSETEGRPGLGTFAYQPPEYLNDDGSQSARAHGRAFDVWSMGCIMIEMATLAVYGWEAQMVNTFRENRLANVHRRRQFVRQGHQPDDSFHNNMFEVNRWVSRLKLDHGSILLDQILKTTEAMLNDMPEGRLYAWEVELDLYDLLHPDNPRIIRLERGAICVQGPPQRLKDGVETPLHRAVRQGNQDRVVKLLEVGWPPYTKDRSGMSPVDLAERGGYLSIQDILAKGSIRIQAITEPASRNVSVVDRDDSNTQRMQITDDLVPNSQASNRIHQPASPFSTRSGWGLPPRTPNGNFQIGLGPQQREDRSWSRSIRSDSYSENESNRIESQDSHLLSDSLTTSKLTEAARSGSLEEVRSILGSVTCPLELMVELDDTGLTPYHWAARSGKGDVVKFFLEQGEGDQMIWLRDRLDKTLLHHASESGSAPVVLLLLEACSDPHSLLLEKDCNGKTALHWAAQKGCDEVARELLNAAQDKVAMTRDMDDSGHTPLQLAMKYGNTGVEHLIREVT